jgi:Family of unknown function (DUF5335)
MSVREIPENEWSEFLDQFSRGHRAWLATVDRGHTGTTSHIEAIERPLGAVVPRISARRVAAIDIRFQDDSHGHEPIRIERPTSVRVDETAEGTAIGLEIVDEEGECTRVRFRAAPLPEMLDDIAPGELPSS